MHGINNLMTGIEASVEEKLAQKGKQDSMKTLYTTWRTIPPLPF